MPYTQIIEVEGARDADALRELLATWDAEQHGVAPGYRGERLLSDQDASDRYRIPALAGGALHGHEHGCARLGIDQDRRVIVGASFAGPGVGELLFAATIAIVGRVPLDTLCHATPAFPTVSEVWLRLLEVDRGIA